MYLSSGNRDLTTRCRVSAQDYLLSGNTVDASAPVENSLQHFTELKWLPCYNGVHSLGL